MDRATMNLHLEAGRRSGWESTCRAKIDYKSEPSAIKAAAKMTAKSEGTRELEAYPCYFCHGWHIGRKMSEAELRGQA